MTPTNLAPIALRRLSPSDTPDVAALYESLSERSRRLRFGTPMPRIPGHVLAQLAGRGIRIRYRGGEGETVWEPGLRRDDGRHERWSA